MNNEQSWEKSRNSRRNLKKGTWLYSKILNPGFGKCKLKKILRKFWKNFRKASEKVYKKLLVIPYIQKFLIPSSGNVNLKKFAEILKKFCGNFEKILRKFWKNFRKASEKVFKKLLVIPNLDVHIF